MLSNHKLQKQRWQSGNTYFIRQRERVHGIFNNKNGHSTKRVSAENYELQTNPQDISIYISWKYKQQQNINQQTIKWQNINEIEKKK